VLTMHTKQTHAYVRNRAQWGFQIIRTGGGNITKYTYCY